MELSITTAIARVYMDHINSYSCQVKIIILYDSACVELELSSYLQTNYRQYDVWCNVYSKELDIGQTSPSLLCLYRISAVITVPLTCYSPTRLYCMYTDFLILKVLLLHNLSMVFQVLLMDAH